MFKKITVQHRRHLYLKAFETYLEKLEDSLNKRHVYLIAYKNYLTKSGDSLNEKNTYLQAFQDYFKAQKDALNKQYESLQALQDYSEVLELENNLNNQEEATQVYLDARENHWNIRDKSLKNYEVKLDALEEDLQLHKNDIDKFKQTYQDNMQDDLTYDNETPCFFGQRMT